ncbi:MAG: toxin-antitoxin system HicB family antitoxin [Moraxellaceae bacterium]|nr:MAG: toxin-antitoxin system HicB family antitoxin [Moraxellaceae bacterium]
MPNRYIYRVTWSEADQERVGLCTEFPSLSGLEEAPEKALSGIRNLVRDCVADMLAQNDEVPEPISSKNYSGKFMVRSRVDKGSRGGGGSAGMSKNTP